MPSAPVNNGEIYYEEAGSGDPITGLTVGSLPVNFPRFLVALLPVPDLLLCAKHLFVEAMVAIVPARVGQ